MDYEKYDDSTIMAHGKHKGKRLDEIPDSWFIWFYEQNKEYAKHNFRLGKMTTEYREHMRLMWEYIVVYVGIDNFKKEC